MFKKLMENTLIGAAEVELPVHVKAAKSVLSLSHDKNTGKQKKMQTNARFLLKVPM